MIDRIRSHNGESLYWVVFEDNPRTNRRRSRRKEEDPKTSPTSATSTSSTTPFNKGTNQNNNKKRRRIRRRRRRKKHLDENEDEIFTPSPTARNNVKHKNITPFDNASKKRKISTTLTSSSPQQGCRVESPTFGRKPFTRQTGGGGGIGLVVSSPVNDVSPFGGSRSGSPLTPVSTPPPPEIPMIREGPPPLSQLDRYGHKLNRASSPNTTTTTTVSSPSNMVTVSTPPSSSSFSPSSTTLSSSSSPSTTTSTTTTMKKTPMAPPSTAMMLKKLQESNRKLMERCRAFDEQTRKQNERMKRMQLEIENLRRIRANASVSTTSAFEPFRPRRICRNIDQAIRQMGRTSNGGSSPSAKSNSSPHKKSPLLSSSRPRISSSSSSSSAGSPTTALRVLQKPNIVSKNKYRNIRSRSVRLQSLGKRIGGR